MTTPSLISSLDRVAHQGYLRSRGQAYLDKAYIQIVTGEPPNTSTGGIKRKAASVSRPGSASNDDDNNDSSSKSDSQSTSKKPRIPHIDSKYRIELVAARPEPSVLVIGEPPDDIYLPSITSSLRLRNAEDRKNVVAGLEERATDWEGNNENEEIQPLFWDYEKLPANQVKMLAEYAWSRQLIQPTLEIVGDESATSATSPEKSNGGTKRQRMANEKAQATMQLKAQEAELDAEIDQLRRSFCDKNRAIALKNRAAAGIW